MSQTYQLSKSGIERLERFKRDVLAGEVNIRSEGFYFVVSSDNGTNCAWTKDESRVIELTLQDINSALNSPAEKRLHDEGSIFYCSTSGSAPGIGRDDITTPAQRALEALANKLNGGINA